MRIGSSTDPLARGLYVFKLDYSINPVEKGDTLITTVLPAAKLPVRAFELTVIGTRKDALAEIYIQDDVPHVPVGLQSSSDGASKQITLHRLSPNAKLTLRISEAATELRSQEGA